jgi:hypothetical protein
MSRLLFAAARGARIQEQRQWSSAGWWDAVSIVIPDYEVTPQRIHPDDEHLQYGPISTALREMAADSSYRGDWEVYFAHVAANEFTEYLDFWQGKPDNSLFYLILAEFLADEGM